mmetsp:Transcript_2033/g.7099  ORF Transcript_2033/g.7099 Transcript_2033/m.7099 type:complete len:255 (-) Transcript_2033:77-841(-)
MSAGLSSVTNRSAGSDRSTSTAPSSYPSLLRFSFLRPACSTSGALCSSFTSAKRCRASSSLGSIFAGALYPRHVTKISADSLRLACGFVLSTLSKRAPKAYSRAVYSLLRNTFVTNVPPGLRKSVARCSASSVSAACVYASRAHAPPTLGAPSCSTTSKASTSPEARFTAWRHRSVVMSSTSVVTPRMGRIGARSTPTMVAPSGMYFCATCSHPPGAAHRSRHERADARKSYLRLSCTSLNAARERKPCSLARW